MNLGLGLRSLRRFVLCLIWVRGGLGFTSSWHGVGRWLFSFWSFQSFLSLSFPLPGRELKRADSHLVTTVPVQSQVQSRWLTLTSTRRYR